MSEPQNSTLDRTCALITQLAQVQKSSIPCDSLSIVNTEETTEPCQVGGSKKTLKIKQKRRKKEVNKEGKEGGRKGGGREGGWEREREKEKRKTK